MEDAKKDVPDEKDQTEITKAGAEVLANALHDKARQMHYSKEENPKYGHLADDIHVEAGDITGEQNGASTVGFSDKAYIARFLNDGTKFRKGDHWYDATVEQTKGEMYQAMDKKYKELKAK